MPTLDTPNYTHNFSLFFEYLQEIIKPNDQFHDSHIWSIKKNTVSQNVSVLG